MTNVGRVNHKSNDKQRNRLIHKFIVMTLLEVMREYLNEKTVLATCVSLYLLENYQVINVVLRKYIRLLRVFLASKQ